MVDSTQSHARYSKTKKEYSSDWLDIIDASEQKATELKETYLVRTVKQVLVEDKRVRRYTFGRKDPQKRNRTILMVGETGTGKSTLINRMLNYMLGVKWEDNIRFEIIPDEDKIDETESKTIEITAYEISGLEEVSIPFSLTVIDTPGFGDREKDKSTALNLYKLLKSLNDVHELHAVCLVVKASRNRQTVSQKYIFHAILSLLGKNMDKNIITLITFSDWSLSSKAVELLIKSGVPSLKDNTFLFNNCPLQQFDKKHEEMYKTSWDNGAESFVEFSQALDKMEPQSLKMTVDILKHHQKLEACIERLEDQIMDVKQKHKALEMQQKAVKELMEKVVSPKKMISTEKIFCKVCQKLCPFPRLWNMIKQLLPDYTCSSCPCKVKDHKENVKIIVLENEIHMNAESIITTAEKGVGQQLVEAVATKTELIDKCFQNISQLQKHALKFDSTHVDSLMKILKKTNETEKVAELQEMMDNKETEKVAELWQMMENKETEGGRAAGDDGQQRNREGGRAAGDDGEQRNREGGRAAGDDGEQRNREGGRAAGDDGEQRNREGGRAAGDDGEQRNREGGRAAGDVGEQRNREGGRAAGDDGEEQRNREGGRAAGDDGEQRNREGGRAAGDVGEQRNREGGRAAGDAGEEQRNREGGRAAGDVGEEQRNREGGRAAGDDGEQRNREGGRAAGDDGEQRNREGGKAAGDVGEQRNREGGRAARDDGKEQRNREGGRAAGDAGKVCVKR
ncbi:hypothetical protein COCON_G00126410 [Conger conger]|uniref:Septin-type G domain-containing protein n=1 Tax=Conger conger TaxID=82655 RepID=A0A9Q1DD32_CONCO|nr:hypothetical protein COCON_G00126410 [Conger conger]